MEGCLGVLELVGGGVFGGGLGLCLVEVGVGVD